MILLERGPAGWEPFGQSLVLHVACGHSLIVWWRPTIVQGKASLGRCTCTTPGCRRDYEDVILEGWAP